MGPGFSRDEPFAAYPRAWLHGLIGDRRSAALVSADGAIDWFCRPGFDGRPVFASLLDARRGGFWKLGPRPSLLGEQEWLDAPILRTRWRTRDAELELEDAMVFAEDRREPGLARATAIVRRLVCRRGAARGLFLLRARGARLWLSRPLPGASAGAPAAFELRRGAELWAVAAFGDAGAWSADRARREVARCRAEWRAWSRGLRTSGPRAARLARSAQAIRLLVPAETGALAAAPTTSLPERIGGDWNADYRLCWLRDTSIALGVLARLGDLEPGRRWLEWLARREGAARGRFQPLYRLDGGANAARRVARLSGFRESRPVVFGNDAYRQRQTGALGFLADFLKTHRDAGGGWDEGRDALVRAIAAQVRADWRKPDNGIWELPGRARYVSSRVLCWLALTRCRELGARDEGLAAEAEAIRRETLRRGWDARRRAFRQRYGAGALDSATLLVSLTGFLPPRDPRVLANIARLRDSLSVDGFMYRFHPQATPGVQPLPLGAFEGAFVPSTLWHASALAAAGDAEGADDILGKVERRAGPSGLLAEAADPMDPAPLGNYPLAFSHAEHALAILRWREALKG